MIIWGIYLFAFYPGMMSADSFNQWEQVITGTFTTHHPPFHTFLVWLVTRIYFSPVSVATAQIVILAMVAAAWFVFFEQIGIPRWAIWISAGLFALSPVNGTMVNTLWKDIPYSASVMGLTLILTKMVFSDGAWLDSLGRKILLGVITAFVLLLRHDGLPLGIGAIIALFFLYPNKWKKTIISMVICLLLYLGVLGPLYKLVGVQKSMELADSSLSLYTMAAYAKPGSQSEKLINSFGFLAPNWNCQISNLIDSEWRKSDLDTSLSSFELVTNFIERMPRVLIYFYRCARSMEWIVWDPYGEVRNASHVQVLVDPNPYGIEHNSKIPWLRDLIAQWVINTSYNPSLNWFTWRPAFFLYIFLFVSLVLIFRNRSIKFGVISIPVLIQSVTFSLIFAEPNFRYHYAVYLMALISWPLLFITIQKNARPDDG
jgi:hypothetical protein